MATSKYVAFFRLHLRRPWSPNSEATNSPLLKVRAYIGIMVVLLTISNNPAIDA